MCNLTFFLHFIVCTHGQWKTMTKKLTNKEQNSQTHIQIHYFQKKKPSSPVCGANAPLS